MNKKEYEYFKSRIGAAINSIRDIKNNIEEIGGFIEAELEEEFNENIDCAIMALSDCLENIESDEAMMELDEKQDKDIEEEE
jgi:hypothetical protein